MVLVVPGVQAGCVFWDTQLGTLVRESQPSRYNLSYLSHRSKNRKMKGDEMKKGNLITYHLLESSICAYIEWLVNELMMTAIKLNIRTHV